MRVFSWIANLGTRADQSDDIKNKIHLTNYLIVLLIITIAVYGIITSFIAPALLKYCLFGGVLYVLNLLISYLGYHQLSRLCIAIFPALVIAILHASIMQEQSLPMNEIYAFQIVACLIAFTVFDLKDVHLWLPAFLISFVLLFQINTFNFYFDAKIEDSVFAMPWLRATIVSGAVVTGAFLIVFLKQINSSQFKKVTLLLDDIEKENKNAADKELALQKTLNDLEMAQKEEAKRNWKTTGLAEIGNMLRVEDDLDQLCDRIIAYIVKYMKANQGALFLLDDDNDNEEKELFIKSAYAYERKKRLTHTIKPGEGLVGQCYLEKDFIYLTEVPDNFVSIKSGLGDANPRSILITPMLVNEEIYGVFEIASFHEIAQYQIDFMMELGENIAMTLNNFKINAKTKILLDETQEQSEQLKSQEEEMRQNMEELQATQEEQDRQQHEMAEKIKQLEQEKAAAFAKLSQLTE